MNNVIVPSSEGRVRVWGDCTQLIRVIPMNFFRPSLLIIVFTFGFQLPLLAHAQGGERDALLVEDPEESAAARSLFHDGANCADQGDWTCAADRFSRSLDLRYSPVVEYNLAVAEAELGELLVAIERFRHVASQEGAPPEVRDGAIAQIAELTEQTPSLTIYINGEGTVFIGDRELPESLHDVPMPIDPGEHVVRFESETGEETQTVSLERGQQEELRFGSSVPTPEEAAERYIASTDEAVQVEEPLDESARRRRRRILAASISAAVVVVATVVIVAAMAPYGGDPTDTDLEPIVFRE